MPDNLESKKPKKMTVRKYIKNNHLQLIAIVLMFILVLYEPLFYNKIRATSILKPLIVLNTMGDMNKEAPIATNADTFKFSLYGFKVKWGKEEWSAVDWKLRYTNYNRDKDRYLIYFKGKAAKKGKMTLTFIDNHNYYINFNIPVEENITEQTYHLGSVKKCYIMGEENGRPKEIEKQIDLFNWEFIDTIRLSRDYSEKGENEISCEKLMILWIDYEIL